MATAHASTRRTREATEPTYDRHTKPLRWLEQETMLYGLSAVLVPDEVLPSLDVRLYGTDGVVVRTTVRDGQRRYCWLGDEITHSVVDPAGAARRIATMLRRQQRERAS